MTAFKKDILFPPGRLVGGNLYEAQTEDNEGRPLTIKSGPNAGQPTQRYYFAVAIPKLPGHTHWGQTEWGAIIWGIGHQCFPQGQASQPHFAWKIIDGDSKVPNTKNVAPNTREGYPGHWVLNFSSSYPSRICDASGNPAPHLEVKDAIKLGHWVQVLGNVDGNETTTRPGVYLNHSAVSLQGYDKVIVLGLDTRGVGFGKGVALPPGVSTTPIGGANPAAMAPPVAAAPAIPTPAALPAHLPAIPGATPAAPQPVAVQPHPTILPLPTPAAPAVPPPPVAAVPAPPPAAPVRQLTPKANGASYEQLIANGWTDALLLQHGMMVA